MMVVDTNVLVRLKDETEPVQQKIALSIFQNNEIIILKTVLLESAWVLSSRLKLAKSDIVDFFEFLKISENIYFEDDAVTRLAIGLYAQGMDFADALHALTAERMQQEIHTFDEKMVKKGRRLRLQNLVLERE